jgi:hypothetical protein
MNAIKCKMPPPPTAWDSNLAPQLVGFLERLWNLWDKGPSWLKKKKKGHDRWALKDMPTTKLSLELSASWFTKI